MKSLAIAICCIILSIATRASVKVEKTAPRECSQFLRIAVMFDGHPLRGAEVSLNLGFNPNAPSFISTNDNGIASVPKLAPGTYRVDISFNGIRSMIFDEPVTTTLFVHVTPRTDISTFSVDLGKPARELWHADEAFVKQLDADGFLPVHSRIRTFQETILDPTGERVASARTWVVRKTIPRWVVVFQGTSDANGHLSGQLPDGFYMAICSLPGFRTAIVPFEVRQDGSGELRVTLQIAEATQ